MTGVVDSSGSFFLPQQPSYGSLLIEVFEALVDMTKRVAGEEEGEEPWTLASDADVTSMSAVVVTNCTLLPGVGAPIFDPPQVHHRIVRNAAAETCMLRPFELTGRSVSRVHK